MRLDLGCGQDEGPLAPLADDQAGGGEFVHGSVHGDFADAVATAELIGRRELVARPKVAGKHLPLNVRDDRLEFGHADTLPSKHV